MIKRHYALPVVLLFLASCASTGKKLDAASVNRIEKGKTTKSQVDALLGPPTSMSLIPDGKRMAFYLYTESNAGTMMIPYYNLVAGGSSRRIQQLQVIYKDDIVQDYEFSDTTEKTGGGAYNQHTIEISPTPTGK